MFKIGYRLAGGGTSMEYREILNKNKEPLGYTKERGEALKAHEYVTVAGVLVISYQQLLVTRRAKNKTFPHKWEFSMGSVQAGETAIEGAVRELGEEVGIITKPEELSYLGSMVYHPRISEIYLLRKDVDKITMQEEEVEAYKFVGQTELNTMLEEGAFSEAMKRRLLHFYPEIVKYIN